MTLLSAKYSKAEIQRQTTEHWLLSSRSSQGQQRERKRSHPTKRPPKLAVLSWPSIMSGARTRPKHLNPGKAIAEIKKLLVLRR